MARTTAAGKASGVDVALCGEEIRGPGNGRRVSGGFSFADGHTETKKWRDSRTTAGFKKGVATPYDRPQPNNPDIAWMQEHATRHP